MKCGHNARGQHVLRQSEFSARDESLVYRADAAAVDSSPPNTNRRFSSGLFFEAFAMPTGKSLAVLLYVESMYTPGHDHEV